MRTQWRDVTELPMGGAHRMQRSHTLSASPPNRQLHTATLWSAVHDVQGAKGKGSVFTAHGLALVASFVLIYGFNNHKWKYLEEQLSCTEHEWTFLVIIPSPLSTCHLHSAQRWPQVQREHASVIACFITLYKRSIWRKGRPDPPPANIVYGLKMQNFKKRWIHMY